MKLLNDLISAVKVRQNEISETLVTGSVTDFEMYQRLVGRYQGLRESIEILNQLLEEKNE
jgi:hypothetical protein